MSHKSRSRLRTLLAIPSAAVLMLGASELLASPAAPARAPDCAAYCGTSTCLSNPSSYYCVWCGCDGMEP